MLYACEKEQCWNFRVKMDQEIHYPDRVENRSICSWDESLCGYTEKEAQMYTRVNTYRKKITNYIVAGCSVEVEIYETKQTTIINK